MNDEAQKAAEHWLSERIQPGNWLDVAPEEEIFSGITGWYRTVVQMHQQIFSPEIRRRKERGDLSDDFVLWAAQLIQPHDGGRIIRINDEIRGVPYIRASRPFDEGDPVTFGDLEGLEVFDLEEDELDSGHFTIFWTGKGWVGSFDFRSGRAKCLNLMEKAIRFLKSARLAIENRLSEPAIDNLHSACELIAKTRLILSHMPADKWKSHSSVQSEINKMGRLGNVDAMFLDTFNRLSRVRSAAKYATGYDAELPTIKELGHIEATATYLKESIGLQRPAIQPDTTSES